MDHPLPSDALDIAFHPTRSQALLAVGLIDGKVTLVDHSRVWEEGEGDDDDGDDDDEPKRKGVGKALRGGDQEDQDSDLDDDDDDVVAPLPSKSKSKTKTLWTRRISQKSVRGVCFPGSASSLDYPEAESSNTTPGSLSASSELWSITKDGTLHLLDVERGGKPVKGWYKGCTSPPSVLRYVEPNVLMTGDDEGVVSLWDTRLAPGLPPLVGSSSGSKLSSAGDGASATTATAHQSCREAGHKPLREYEHHFDWITDAIYSLDLEGAKKTAKEREEERKREQEEKGAKGKRRRWRERKRRRERGEEDEEAEGEEDKVERRGRERLIVTSGDGTLSTIDPRMGKKGVEVSEDQEDELLSVCALKYGRKLIVGTQLGMLSLWSPSRGLLDHVDRIPGHPSSVDSLCKLDEDTLLTGSSDGLIRVVQVLPHRLLGIVGDHEGMPVERIRRKEGLVASVGHGLCVRLTDVRELLEEGSEGEEDEDDEDEEEEEGGGQSKVRVPMGLGTGGTTWSDEEGEDDDEDDEEAAERGLVDVGSDSDDDEGSSASASGAPRRKKARTKASRRDDDEDEDEEEEEDDDESDDSDDGGKAKGSDPGKGVRLNKSMTRKAKLADPSAMGVGLGGTSMLAKAGGGGKKGKGGAAGAGAAEGFWDGL